MTFDDQDNYQAAYAYGLERIKVQALDDTRPESQDPLYYLYDGLGSVRQLIRPNGAVRDHYNYDEFGVPGPGAKLSEDGRNVNHNTFGYTGEMWDEEDDLLYLRSRHYAPKLGRFLTRDVFPGYITNPLSMHKYAYVENNPVNFIDPLGFNKKEQSKYGYNDDIYRNYSKNYDDYMRQKADEATKIFVDSEGIRRKGMNVDYEYYENLAALGLWEAIPDQVRREMEGIKPDPVGEFVFIDLPAGGIAGGARSALGRTVTKEVGEAVVKISSSSIKHIGKHIPMDFAEQVAHLSDDALANKLANTSFFNPKWSKEQIISAVEKGYTEALNKGKTGVYDFTFQGETIKIVIKSDGTFDTAYGLHKLTAEYFRR